MRSYHQAYHDLKAALLLLYTDHEAQTIAHEVVEWITNLSKLERLLQKEQLLTPTQTAQYNTVLQQLNQGMPMQYVLGHAWFGKHRFAVNEHVLIPRPETEELVDWILSDLPPTRHVIADVGTGSGCIAISLYLGNPKLSIHAIDISPEALQLAQFNAQQLQANIHWYLLDILNNDNYGSLPMMDVIVSNPPYIPLNEYNNMAKHVVDYEPHLALFVPDHQPLLFYEALVHFSQSNLHAGGWLYAEVEQNYAQQVAHLWQQMSLQSVVTKKDMHGNWRMIKAQKP
jgi:release factor glutamine methyltransferase